jgi:hypothetical protein
VLLASLRDKGGCPCPRCLVRKNLIPEVGTRRDQRRREADVREDNAGQRYNIARARSFIYEKGYVVNSKAVDGMLKARSLVPTIVSCCLEQRASC